MPTIEQFEAVNQDLAHRRLDTQALFDELPRIWPEPADLAAYLEWTANRANEKLQHQRTPISATEFIARVDMDNLLVPAAQSMLIDAMERDVRPWIPLGRGLRTRTLYRLIPDTYGLRPQRLEYDEPANGEPVLPPCFLGLNATVQPREPARPANRRQDMLSEQSTRTASSDDDAPGFEFFQLGILEYIQTDENDDECGLSASLDEAHERDWLPSGFCVVARLSRTGHADGIYAIYDMFPPRGGRYGPREQMTLPSWGVLPSAPEEQFSCARIGDRLGAMGFGTIIAWEEKLEHPVELVRLVRSWDGSVRRITLDGARLQPAATTA